MIFNSISFGIFLFIVFTIYWFILKNNLKLQNLFVLVSSYVFYGWWDSRFLILIVFSSLIDYFVGLGLEKNNSNKIRKLLLFTSVFINIGLLGIFKYFNFFIDNFVEATQFFGFHINLSTIHIILPVGISFYTFQTLSYSIDVYRRTLKPTRDIIAFFAFVSFFPQLVAGPIERASNLLPQFYKKRKFVYASAVDGLRQILWGLFKKVVIADNCARYVNDIFSNYTDYSGTTLILGGVFFAFQIYGDFSGYSDIAIGTARLFGFNLMQNFAFPYFSRDIAEFWRRWHISLSTWFRDYLYIPLGGSRVGPGIKIRNMFIIFLVSGFWHGANWTFIVWGFLNAIYFLPLMLTKSNRNNTDIVAHGKLFPTFKEFFQIGVTFFLTVFAWIFFRAENIWIALAYIKHLVLNIHIATSQPFIFLFDKITIFLLLLIIVEWLQRDKQHALDIASMETYKKWVIYTIIALIILNFGITNETPFIYFQF